MVCLLVCLIPAIGKSGLEYFSKWQKKVIISTSNLGTDQNTSMDWKIKNAFIKITFKTNTFFGILTDIKHSKQYLDKTCGGRGEREKKRHAPWSVKMLSIVSREHWHTCAVNLVYSMKYSVLCPSNVKGFLLEFRLFASSHVNNSSEMNTSV